ncbi:hypothetical protein [Methanococcoides sp. AM1]|uniref:hypothetical protein n=1 Tax=Methanococcoides sp. AM1 TaxID=1201011 RepID=UPI0010834F3E|nr:hypothetical protein [Methanococcoides sp. AM1]
MEPSVDLFYIGSGLVTAAFVALIAKYYTAKVLIAKLNVALSFADELVTELSELIEKIDAALKDDALSKDEITAIMAELNDVVEKLKQAAKLVKNKQVPE